MSLQTESGAAYAIGDDSLVNFPPSALMQMFEDVRVAMEIEPERAATIAFEFISRIASSTRRSTDVRGGLAPWQRRRVDRYLRENLEHSIRICELAREAKLSVSHFCRAFKESFGETPHTYLLHLRLELARKLMVTTSEPLSQIALICGLSDQAHLSKLFRRTFHDTPNAWRRRNLTDSQAERCQRAKAGVPQAA